MMGAMFALTTFLARLLGLTARFQNGWTRVDLGLRAHRRRFAGFWRAFDVGKRADECALTRKNSSV